MFLNLEASDKVHRPQIQKDVVFCVDKNQVENGQIDLEPVIHLSHFQIYGGITLSSS